MRRRLAAVVVLALVVAGCASAAPDEPVEDALRQEIVDLIGTSPGGAVTLHRHQGTVDTIAVGDANAAGRPLDADDRFRVGSISKPFVAVMVLQLVAEGSLDLDAPLSEYLETPIGGDVSVRQLLSHRSGVPSYTDNAELMQSTMTDRAATISADDIFEAVSDMQARAPGAPFQYSNTNYLLAGLLIEAVDEVDLNTALQRRIAAPLGLTQTSFELAELGDGDVGGWSLGLLSGDPTDDYRSIASGAWAAGALVSTAGELLIFLDALASDELLPKALAQEMTTAGAGYGLGIQVRTQDTSTLIGHGGAIPGFLSSMEIATDTGDAVIVLVNNDRLRIDRIVAAIEQSR